MACHYLGYAKENWLDVIWMCSRCHKKTHPGLTHEEQVEGILTTVIGVTEDGRPMRWTDDPNRVHRPDCKCNICIPPENRIQKGKLIVADIIDIKCLLALPDNERPSSSEIAFMCGVTPSIIYFIKSGKHWSYIKVEHYDTDKEAILERIRIRSHQKLNLEHIRAVHNAATARRRQRLLVDMLHEDKELSVAYRKAIKNDLCFYCNKRSDIMHDDHIVPLARGGTDHWWNLVRACAKCNLRKHVKTAEEFMLELLQETV